MDGAVGGQVLADYMASLKKYPPVPPEAVVMKYCGRVSGCSIRIGMHNWDDTGRVASRDFLFFYNPVSHTWRASAGDTAGTNMNNTTEHINHTWSCYFTDGKYANWQNQGDTDSDFGLLRNWISDVS